MDTGLGGKSASTFARCYQVPLNGVRVLVLDFAGSCSASEKNLFSARFEHKNCLKIAGSTHLRREGDLKAVRATDY